MEHLKQLIDQKRFDEARSRLYEMARKDEDYNSFLSLCRYRTRLQSNATSWNFPKTIRVALLGGSTMDLLKLPLELAVESAGLGCELFLADYNTYAQEMLDAGSATVAFNPEVVLLLTNTFNIPQWPKPGDSKQSVETLVSDMSRYWLDLCASLHARCQCEIIVNNFHSYSVRPMGNMASKVPWDRNTFIKKLNIELGEQAPHYVHIHDIESLAESYGVRNWFDSRFWYHAKQPVSFSGVVPYVKNVANIIGAIYGRSAKCLVLDLDNTLWGGVVGDDGPDGIAIGEGDPVGEAFLAFQDYLLQLKKRGVLLAVCSKNEEVNALAPFTHRPEMLLRQDDFVVFKANWLPKPENIKRIAYELNIGLDSLVFVDDNPAEREHVRQELPQVRVVELSADPSDYAQQVDRTGWFEVVSLSAEDAQRTTQYLENTKRQELLESTGNYDEYLKSLDQRAVIGAFEEKHLDRIAQLINKTNQFNLTTKRMSRSEVEKVMMDPEYLHGYVKLADCFGDNGLISIFIGHRENQRLILDLWLMSCRVLKRGVEHLLANYLVEKARERGITSIRGLYIPTTKNGLVREHYPSLGFAEKRELPSGEVQWDLQVEAYRPFQVQIQLVGE